MSDVTQIRWPPGWREKIDEVIGETNISEFTKSAVAKEMKRLGSKLPEQRGRGRPPKKPENKC